MEKSGVLLFFRRRQLDNGHRAGEKVPVQGSSGEGPKGPSIGVNVARSIVKVKLVDDEHQPVVLHIQPDGDHRDYVLSMNPRAAVALIKELTRVTKSILTSGF